MNNDKRKRLEELARKYCGKNARGKRETTEDTTGYSDSYVENSRKRKEYATEAGKHGKGILKGLGIGIGVPVLNGIPIVGLLVPNPISAACFLGGLSYAGWKSYKAYKSIYGGKEK